MTQFIADNLLFSIFLSLFIVEQISYYFMGSYAYRYGFIIKRIPAPSAERMISDTKPFQLCNLTVKVNRMHSEIFLHDKYPFGTLGPLLFVGQVTLDNGGTALIRIGPLSASFISYVIIDTLFSVENILVDFLNIGCLALLVAWLYFRFYRNYQELIKANSN